MKRFLVTFSCVLLSLVSLSGCGGSTEVTVSEPAATATDTTVLDKAVEEANKGYDGTVKEVPGEESAHAPQ